MFWRCRKDRTQDLDRELRAHLATRQLAAGRGSLRRVASVRRSRLSQGGYASYVSAGKLLAAWQDMIIRCCHESLGIRQR